MKKLMIGIGLLLAVTLVPGCQETVEQQDGKWVKIVARAPQTKTVNDGLDTKWSSTDGITVFHATAGSDAFVCDGEFVISDKDNGVFRGELASALEGEAYDWYLLYPYASSNTNPAEMAVTIGGASQTQSAAGSMSHVAGEICPLYAVIGAVGKDQTPGGEMSHLASVIEVNVKNLGSEDLTVSEIGFVASEDVVGNYKVDITGTSPVYVKAGESEVSSEITLSLTESAVIQPSDSAQFYLVVKPFVAPSGSSMKVIVNETEFDLNPAADASFSAGKIKKVNVSYGASAPAGGTYVYDLTVASYNPEESGPYNVQWTQYPNAKIQLSKFNGTMNANAWLPTASIKTSGAYKNQKLRFIPAEGYAITSIVINAVDGYVKGLIDAEYINGVMAYEGLTLSILPIDGTQEVSLIPTEPCRMTGVTMTYVPVSSYPSLAAPSITNASVEKHTVTVVWSDVPNATKYLVECGGSRKIMDAGVGEMSVPGVLNGIQEVTVTAVGPGYRSVTSNTSVTVDYSPDKAVLDEALIKAHFTNAARQVESYAEYVDYDQRITWVENCFCPINVSYIQIRHDEVKTNSLVYIGMQSQLAIKKVTVAITAILPAKGTKFEDFNAYSGTVSLYSTPDGTEPIVSTVVIAAKEAVLELPEGEYKTLYMRHSSSAAARIWNVEVDY